ncbi:erythromycin esterase family protein [Chitinimonas koreensis]|uniref:erythromycin esterase family protein n=1 Tax=Chitinimonas koreensis TaxID=356302 RepID=UPI0012FA19FF|nr:erythromycin esterase family protein [Chitinimonas koreensis]QNM95747.1 erythromycin esterase family protein [Chitinimonas koreensis]
MGFVLACALSLGARGEEAPAELARWLAGQVVPLASVDPAAPDDADLAAFGRAVGEARIVALGEVSHGESNTFLLKSRLVRYLHERKGFEVLLLESGMYDGQSLWHEVQAGAAARQASFGSLFYMYNRSVEMRALYDYVDRHKHDPRPLVLTAMDTPHGGARSQAGLLPGLAGFLRGKGLGALATGGGWNDFTRVAEAVLAMRAEPPAAAELAAFERAAARLDAALAGVADAYAFPDSSGFWRRQIDSIAAQGATMWDPARPYARDVQMARNVEYLADRYYAGRKVIVWAMTGHALDLAVHAARADGDGGGARSMGEALQRRYGDAYYKVAVAGHAGRHREFTDGSLLHVDASRACSLEAAWHAGGQPMGFLDLRGARATADGAHWLDSPATTVGLSYYADGGCYEGPLGDYVDGLFYVDRIEPAEMEAGFRFPG